MSSGSSVVLGLFGLTAHSGDCAQCDVDVAWCQQGLCHYSQVIVCIVIVCIVRETLGNSNPASTQQDPTEHIPQNLSLGIPVSVQLAISGESNGDIPSCVRASVRLCWAELKICPRQINRLPARWQMFVLGGWQDNWGLRLIHPIITK